MVLKEEKNEKAAIKLIKSGALIYCDFIQNSSMIEGLFKDNSLKKSVKTVIKSEDFAFITCSCGKSQCEHFYALRLHAKNFINDNKRESKESGVPDYNGLIIRDRERLFSELTIKEKAYLKININGSPPHLPSKWSQMKFSVDIHYLDKVYRGSLGNLRQIQNKGVVGAIKIEEYLSLQEKQIIRFLAYNAEYEESLLLLNSEKASDFFHCLFFYNNIFCEKCRISFFPYQCEIAAGIILKNNRKIVIPVLRSKNYNLSLENANIVLGQNGIWVGIFGKYFWLPGTRDVKWLRDFIRSKKEFINDSELSSELNNLKDAGIQILESNDIAKKAKTSTPIPVLLAKIANDESLYLKLLFDYDGDLFPSNADMINLSYNRIIERDLEFENKIKSKILFAGFKQENSVSSLFYTKEKELISLFFSKLVEEWKSSIKIFVEYQEKLNANIVPHKLSIAMKIAGIENESFIINCDFHAGNNSISVHDVIKAVEEDKRYFSTKDNIHFEVTNELKRFINEIKDILIRAEIGNIRLSKAQAKMWNELSNEFTFAKLPEITEFASKLDSKCENVELPQNLNAILRPYQVEGYQWIISRFTNGLNCLLADEMGLGKTVQAIAVLQKLKEEKNKKGLPFKAIVLCPSCLTENWQMEFAKFANSIKTLLIHGPGRNELWNEVLDSDVIISSYPTFKRDIDKYTEIIFDLVILDEAQHIKNPQTGNARSCKKIRANHKLVLTGTPIENAPVELWSIVDFLHPGILGSHNYFKKQFNVPEEKIKDALKRFSIRISPIILRRRKDDVSEQIPPKMEQFIYCDMDEIQSLAYKQIFETTKEKFIKLSSEKVNPVKFEILSLLLRLRQFCCHPSLLPKEYNISDVPSAKTELLKELLLETEDSGQKTIVFSQFPQMLKIIADWLISRNIDFEYIDGTINNRLERVERFNSNEKCMVFLISIRAGGFGLNITSAERIIIYDPWWNPAVEEQAAARSHRIGQEKNLTIQKLILKDSIEEKVINLQERKKIIFNEIIEKSPSTFRNLSIEDIRELFK